MSNNAKYYKSTNRTFVKVGINQDTNGYVDNLTVCDIFGEITFDPKGFSYEDKIGWKECPESEFTNAYNKAMVPFREFMSEAKDITQH